MKYLLYTVILTIVSCELITQKDETKYSYSDDFKAYFKSTFKENIKPESEYFVVPLSSCAQCVDSALDHLARNNFKWVVILVGQTEDSVRLRNISITQSKYVLYKDTTSELLNYSVSIGLPTLLKSDHISQIISKTEYHYGSW